MQPIHTPDAPAAIGPYSQAIVAAGLCFCSGQIPIDAATGRVVYGDVAEQTRLVLANLSAVLAAAGASLSDVVKTTVYLHSMDDFSAMNAVYSEFFAKTRPARATVEVSRLPRDVSVEIDCVAVVPDQLQPR